MFRRKFHLLVTVAIDKGDDAVATRLKARQRKVPSTVSTRHVQRRFLEQQRFLANLFGGRVTVLIQVMLGITFFAKQEKANARIFLFTCHRLIHENAARNGKRIDNRTRREHHLERFCQGVPMQVLDAARKRNRVRSPCIKYRTRRKHQCPSAHFKTQFFIYRRRNRNGATRNRGVNPFVKFKFHHEFVRMVRRIGCRINARYARGQLIFGAATRRHLRRTGRKHRHQKGREKRTIFQQRRLHQSIM